MNTCRLCKSHENTGGDMKLVKYSTRHYAHAGCALDKWGSEFFNRLTSHQRDSFPYFTAKRRGLVIPE